MCTTWYAFKNKHLKTPKLKSALLQNYSQRPWRWCLTAMNLSAFLNIVILAEVMNCSLTQQQVTNLQSNPHTGSRTQQRAPPQSRH